MSAAVDDYAGIVSHRVSAEAVSLSAHWLSRLHELLSVQLNDVFPSEKLLDHIPALIADIAVYLRAAADDEIAANAAVIDKARELGVLRHEQRASVHQVLREYEMLSEILEAFIADETVRLGLQPSSAECFEVQRRLTRSTRTLMRITVETFISAYTMTIQEQNDRLQAFNRMASHELRSPVGTLVFAAAILENDAVRADGQRLAKVARTIQTNAERLSLLITNLQRVAGLTEAIDFPSQQNVEVAAIANEVARQLDDMASSRQVTIRVSDSLPAVVVDPARLELILLNLVSNAIKYSNSARTDAFVEMGTADSDPGDAAHVIYVRDNGLGIASEDQQAIFDRFFRAHAHLDGEMGISGTGLGLAIVSECVQAIGGTVRCESTVGEGTTFFVTVPRTA